MTCTAVVGPVAARVVRAATVAVATAVDQIQGAFVEGLVILACAISRIAVPCVQGRRETPNLPQQWISSRCLMTAKRCRETTYFAKIDKRPLFFRYLRRFMANRRLPPSKFLNFLDGSARPIRGRESVWQSWEWRCGIAHGSNRWPHGGLRRAGAMPEDI